MPLIKKKKKKNIDSKVISTLKIMIKRIKSTYRLEFDDDYDDDDEWRWWRKPVFSI